LYALEQTTLGALELDEVAQVARVENELLFAERPLELRIRARLPRCPRGVRRHRAAQRAERLQEQGVRTGSAGNVLHVVHAGQQNDADRIRVWALLQLATERETVHAGHADIEHDHIWPLGGDPLFGLGCASGLVHVDLDVFERRAQQCAESCIVVYQQQSHRSPRIECLSTAVIGS
jgi:hypothetical protein